MNRKNELHGALTLAKAIADTASANANQLYSAITDLENECAHAGTVVNPVLLAALYNHLRGLRHIEAKCIAKSNTARSAWKRAK